MRPRSATACGLRATSLRCSRNRETATPAAPLDDVSWLGRRKIEARSRRRARTSGTPGHRASSRSAHWRADPSRGAYLPARDDLRIRSPSRAHFSVFSSARRGTLPSGAGGGSCFAISGAARSAGAQGCRAKRGRGARVGAVRWAASTGLLRRRPCDEALGAEHRSAVARRPQAVADRGRMSETGTPTHPATRGLRAPAARQALRHPAKLRRRR